MTLPSLERLLSRFSVEGALGQGENRAPSPFYENIVSAPGCWVADS